MKKLLCILTLISCTSVFATETSVSSNIAIIHSYPDYGGGDVVFTLDTPSNTCKGYWLKKDSPGHAATLSMILAAYQSKTKVKVWGHNQVSHKWPGSSTHYCKLYTIAYGR